MADRQQQLEQALLERGLVKPEQLERVHGRMKKEQRSFEDVVRDEKIVFPEQLAQVRADILGVPYIDLSTVAPSEAAMRDISKQAAATYRFVAFEERDNKLLMAMESPDDFQALEAVKFIAKKRGMIPEIYLASAEGVDRLLGGAADVQAEIGSALRDFGQELAAAEVGDKDKHEIERVIEEAPVTKVVAVIIRHAIEGDASDIHIEPTGKEVRVRYRIDGTLHTSLLLPRRVHAAIVSRVKILADLKIDESRLPQDGRFSTVTDGRAFDFRVSTMPTTYGEKVALRILDKSKGPPSFEELGLEGKQLELFNEGVKSPHGIVLLSGPTGAGKSTTLFAALNMLNTTDVNITTLEDPVEYEITGISQTQVNADIGLTFASGLRNMLRQDPDIMMVGEIRDKETAALAVHASLTGHLVLSTIHTNDALGTVPRLVDMGIDPYLLTATLQLLAAQRLVARLCEECKQEVEIPAAVMEEILEEMETVPDDYKESANQKDPRVLYRAEGCPACQEAGSVGRMAIFEIVPVTREVRTAMNELASYDILKEVARKQGSITMRQDGLLKALQGRVLYEDVLRVTSEVGAGTDLRAGN